jgi:hypothetical protein
MQIRLAADDVRLDVAKDARGQLTPSLAAARNGTLLVEFTKAELQHLLLAFAQAGAAEQGVKIESADLTLASAGPRAVTASVRVRAKKGFIPATLVIDGRADVDEQLAVTLSGLRATGEGVVGSMVSGVIGGKLREHEGKRFDLRPAALRSLRLRGLQVDPGDPLRVSAAFEG